MQRINQRLYCSVTTRVASLFASICLSGCVILPLPNHKVYEGTEIKAESLQWLRAGETTRAQVVEKLGTPNLDFIDQQTIAYAWSGQSGGVLIFIGYGGGVEPIAMRRALMIRFDSDNKAAAYSFIGRPTEIITYDVHTVSIDAKYDDWKELLKHWMMNAGQITDKPGATPK